MPPNIDQHRQEGMRFTDSYGEQKAAPPERRRVNQWAEASIAPGCSTAGVREGTSAGPPRIQPSRAAHAAGLATRAVR